MRTWCKAGVALMSVVMVGAAQASVVGTAVNNAGNKLVTNQAGNGCWASEPDYTGPIAAGLVDAYASTGNPAYKAAAQNAGGFIMTTSSLLGDEAYALTRISAVQANPNANPYRTSALTYFNSTVAGSPGGTSAYINNFVNHYTTTFNEQSQAVIYLAYYTLGAYSVGATDAPVWRSGLINALGMVDDSDYFPVESLGAGVWALASTGNGLSSGTTISGPSTVLNGMTLANLPGLLTSQIVPSGPPTAGSVYFDFAHSGSGYTEDLAMALLGMEAANAMDGSLNYGAMIATGKDKLSGAVAGDGSTYMDVLQGAPSFNVYGGRTLQALASVPEPSGVLLLAVAGIWGLRRRRIA